jgi:hypothetical protein
MTNPAISMTKKQLRPEDEIAMNALRDRLLLTIGFFEDAEEFPSGEQMRDLVKSAAAKGDLRTLRLMSREIDAMSIALAPHKRDGLEAILHQRFGIDKEKERAVLAEQIAGIIARGTIASEKERRRLEDYAEMLEATGGDRAEIDAMRRLVNSD